MAPAAAAKIAMVLLCMSASFRGGPLWRLAFWAASSRQASTELLMREHMRWSFSLQEFSSWRIMIVASIATQFQKSQEPFFIYSEFPGEASLGLLIKG